MPLNFNHCVLAQAEPELTKEEERQVTLLLHLIPKIDRCRFTASVRQPKISVNITGKPIQAPATTSCLANRRRRNILEDTYLQHIQAQ